MKFTIDLHIVKEELNNKACLALRAGIFPNIDEDIQKACIGALNRLLNSMGIQDALAFAPNLKLEVELCKDDIEVKASNSDFPVDIFKGMFIQELVSDSPKKNNDGVIALPFSRYGYMGYFYENTNEVDIASLGSFVQTATQIVSNVEAYSKAVSVFDLTLEEDRESVESLIELYSPKISQFGESSDAVMAALLLSLSKNFDHAGSMVKIVELLLVLDALNSGGDSEQSLLDYTFKLIAGDCDCNKCLYNKNQALIMCTLLNSIDSDSRFSAAISNQAALSVSLVELYGNEYVDLSKFSNRDLL